MTSNDFDAYRPPEEPRRRRRGKRRADGPPRGRRRQVDDGSREMPMVEDVQFSSYYGRPVVKAPPWGAPIGLYLFVGGLAGASGIIAAGADLTGRTTLRRNARLVAMASIGVGTPALIEDLGRPERFLHMMRVVKVTSPMSLGTWILSSFSSALSVTVAAEVDRMLGERLPLGPMRPLLRLAERPSGLFTAAMGAPLAAYTAVLLGDTAVPTWNAARRTLPFVFVSSATLAAAGGAMLTTPVRETAPARMLAVAGVVGDVVAMHITKEEMHPLEREPLEEGKPGAKLKWAERLAIAGGIGAAFGGRHRLVAAASGAALLAASALTRFGVLEAGIESTKDPRRVIEPQKERLAARQAKGITDDSITTAG